jgi:hypothetical protein
MKGATEERSDARKLVDTGAQLFLPAIRAPGEEDEGAADDHHSRAEADARPDVPEDHDPEDSEEKDRDRCAAELEDVAAQGP